MIRDLLVIVVPLLLVGGAGIVARALCASEARAWRAQRRQLNASVLARKVR